MSSAGEGEDGGDRMKPSSPLPQFSSSGEVISSWFKAISSNQLDRPHLDGGKQHYDLTQAVSPSIPLWAQDKQYGHLTNTVINHVYSAIFEVEQSPNEHPTPALA